MPVTESDFYEKGSTDCGKPALKSLREVIELIRHEHIAARKSKREISHLLANEFLDALPGLIKVIVSPTGNANYFCVEIDGIELAVTPFGSHEEWWDKPSKGFRQLVKSRGCRWGVVLFDIKREGLWEGLWIEGPDFDEKVLKKQETVNSSMINKVRGKRIVHPFTESGKFIDLVKHPPPKPGKPYLVRKIKE
jgi:hypothetical protein